MTETFPYGKRSSYPHMKPGDVAIWERFIDKFPEAYDTVEYDFPLGSPPAFDTVVNQETQGDALLLYKLKIDVVGHKGDTTDIIEVKPLAGGSALGQVMKYQDLFIRDFKPSRDPDAVVITDAVTDDTLHSAEKRGVKIIVV